MYTGNSDDTESFRAFQKSLYSKSPNLEMSLR